VSVLHSHGIEVALPAGFEGRIYRRRPADGDHTYAVAHFGTFALPADAADFGTGAFAHMASTDIFAALLEYGPESAGRRLFAGNVMPRSLTPGDFQPHAARSGAGKHSGSQHFFVEAGRPFTLYAVLGSHLTRRLLVRRLNLLLDSVRIQPVDDVSRRV
jgi:hypothetical protein